jgi:polyphosphate kinase
MSKAEAGGPAKPGAGRDLDDPELYINRELSWLEFNERVLQEGLSSDVPPLERLKFLSIVGSNLDEFMMIRVGGLCQQCLAGLGVRGIAGMTPEEQLAAIRQRVRRMVAAQAAGIREVRAALVAEGFCVLSTAELGEKQRRFASGYFDAEIAPVLTVLAVGELDPFPDLPGASLNAGVVLETPGEEAAGTRLAVVPVPDCLPRFVRLPGERQLEVIAIEELVLEHLGRLFPGRRVVASALFRITRDGDVSIDDDDVEDLLGAVERAVHERRHRGVVRLELSAGADQRLRSWLLAWLDITEEAVIEVAGMLGTGALMELAARPGFESLKYPDWPPLNPRDLGPQEDLWAAIRDRDIMTFLPYESFEPVVRLVNMAAADPGVLAVKMTLYRAEKDSPIMNALARAAEAGKQVTVLVELKARFDEAKNVVWARRLEDAGCHVIYGIAGLKTHAKVLLVVRREEYRIRRYLHLSTGNYNGRTARIYSDLGLLTSDPGMVTDAASFFNLLTGFSQPVEWSRFCIAPTGLRSRIEELIRREIDASSPDQPGLIMAKVNSLQDRGICRALYEASRSGVRVLLNVRGICCLRPGVEGVSDNIEVVSIVDRFLEHARIVYFRNGGHEEVYLSSADWMTRNLDKRLEVMFPVQAAHLRRRAIGILEACFKDNVKASRLRPDGTWRRRTSRSERCRAQERFYLDAQEAVQAGQLSFEQFRPLTSPEGLAR